MTLVFGRYFRKANRWQLSFAGAGVAFVVFLALSVGYRSGMRSSSGPLGSALAPGQAPVKGDEPSKLHVEEFFRVQVQQGRETCEVRAHDAKYYAQDNVTFVTSAEVKVFRRKKKPVLISADSARLYLEGDTMKHVNLQGNVRVEIENSAVLKTDMADYDADTQYVSAPGFVTISGPGYETSGSGMEMQVDADTVTLLKDVKSRYEQGAALPSALGDVR